VKLRIIAAIVGVAALAVLLVGLPLALAVEHLYTSQEILRIEREASEMRNAVNVSSLATHDPVEFPRNDSINFAVYDPSGRRVDGNGPDVADDPVRRALLGDELSWRCRSTATNA
jgi:cytochrome c-type biogenesis protein CcmE